MRKSNHFRSLKCSYYRAEFVDRSEKTDIFKVLLLNLLEKLDKLTLRIYRRLSIAAHPNLQRQMSFKPYQSEINKGVHLDASKCV